MVCISIPGPVCPPLWSAAPVVTHRVKEQFPKESEERGGGEGITWVDKRNNVHSLVYPLYSMFSQFSCSVMYYSLQHMDCSTPGFPVHHQFPELAQTCLLSQWCHPTISSSVSSSAFNLSQHQGLFQWVSSSHQVAKVLELQLQHQSFQWMLRTDFL